MSSLTYRAEIDSLRALAVFAVIFFHLNENYLPGGYLGVDIFFVISGYVITQTLFKNYLKNNKIDIINFYIRRIKRIYPLLIFVVCTTLLLISLFSILSNYQYFLRSSITSIFGVSNLFYLRTNQDYFLQEVINPFLHTWSLGIEEQFYLFYPLFLLLALKISDKFNLNKFALFYLFLFISILFFSSFYFNKDNIFGHFFFPLARFWELSVGCATFFIYNFSKINFDKFKAFTFIFLAIIFYVFFFKTHLNNINFEILIIVISTSIIILTIDFSKINNFFLSKSVIFLGKISYGIYLWHLPIIYFFSKLILNKSLYSLSVISVSILLSSVSFFFIEDPLRKTKRFDKYLSNFVKFFPIVIIILSIIFSVNFLKTKVELKKILASIENIVININLNKRNDILKYNSHYKTYNFNGSSIAACHSKNKSLSKDHYLVNCYKKNKSNVFIHMMGDSTIPAYVPMVENSNYSFDLLVSSLTSGFYVPELLSSNIKNLQTKNFEDVIIDQKHLAMNMELNEDLTKKYQENFIILSSMYSKHIHDRIIIDENFNPIRPKEKIYELFEEKLDKFIKSFEKKINIIFIANTMEPKFKIAECLQFLKGIEDNCYLQSKVLIDKRRREVLEIQKKLTNKYSNVYLFDVLPLMCKKNKCSYFQKKNRAFMADNTHLTVETSKNMSSFFDKFLKENFKNLELKN